VTLKRIGFERVEIEWTQSSNYDISRIYFTVNNEIVEYPIEQYEFKGSIINFLIFIIHINQNKFFSFKTHLNKFIMI
jgi:hypothetical protein